LTGEQIESLVGERNDAKKKRDFSRADQIRDQLLQQGVVLEDTKSGTRWKRK
jgi:cysteinyl-tRNA synthetase